MTPKPTSSHAKYCFPSPHHPSKMSTNTNTDIFTIHAVPGTDIWRKPPTTNIYNAPTAAPRTTRSRGPLSSFLSARASFSFPWRERYDQAGILLAFRPRSSSFPSETKEEIPQKWIKTGIEFYQSAPQFSTVATDNWADWSVTPLTSPTDWTTILVEKSGDKHGKSLWVYRVVLDEKTGEEKERIALREICWVYGLDGEAWDLEVVAMAARPEKNAEGGEELVVKVRGWEVKWEEE
ncbi:unnamed protein product [Sordaria macrospora k-hell]|uniref:WGS project CABT00000000 data, contig 2.2 n=2 Tax=Sordaria macrospora TaxID=5147 RepID=F7VNW9_SORMK|nr:uncharacterized protein SMAC_01072 [Sordaria macrospora k-hell]KAH7630554.1 hypothetical protein B0T09DRAFT_262974 [Sordaria sp. MPI-SDFR-AT-0083]CCC07048.1 unnamed protein product [Sordaria macrospora k-hell]